MEKVVSSINGSCVSHVIINKESERKAWQNGQSAHLIKDRKLDFTFLKCKEQNVHSIKYKR